MKTLMIVIITLCLMALTYTLCGGLIGEIWSSISPIFAWFYAQTTLYVKIAAILAVFALTEPIFNHYNL